MTSQFEFIFSFIYFSTRAVYISGMVYYGIGMLVLGLWPTKWGVLVFSTSAGILYGTIFTVPFILVARYHAKNCVSKMKSIGFKNNIYLFCLSYSSALKMVRLSR